MNNNFNIVFLKITQELISPFSKLPEYVSELGCDWMEG